MSVTTELSVAAEPTEVLLPVVNFVHRHRLGSIVAAIVEAHAPLVRVAHASALVVKPMTFGLIPDRVLVALSRICDEPIELEKFVTLLREDHQVQEAECKE